MNTWAEINAKKYGEMAMLMIQAANLNVDDFAQEPCSPSFRIVHQPTQNYFAFGGENGGANWTRPGFPGGGGQTGTGREEPWDTKIRHFEHWLKQLRAFLAAIAENTMGKSTVRSIAPEPQVDPPNHHAGLQIRGPDDIALLIESYADGYVWKFYSESVEDIAHLRLEIVSVRSFDAQKHAFRAPREFVVRWSATRNLKAGDLTKAVRFFGFEGEHLEFGNASGAGHLVWPSGDLSAVHRWLLSLRVVGLTREWPIELDLIWTQNTKDIDLRVIYANRVMNKSSDDGARNGGQMNCPEVEPTAHGSLDREPSLRNDEATTGEEQPRTTPLPGLLDRVSPQDPNYLLVKKGFLQSWSDSHGLVAAAFEGRVSLTEYVAGCVRTFEQGAQIQVAFKDSITVTAKCDEIDVMMHESIRRFNDSLSAEAGFGEDEIETAQNEYFRRVNAVAFRAKQQLMNAVLTEIEEEHASEPTSPSVQGSASPESGAFP